MLTFEELSILIEKWQKYNFPNAKVEEPFLGMVEELGELSHAHLKCIQGIRGTPEEHLEAKKDAIGDILVYMIHYCRMTGINPVECLETAWNEIKTRDWIKYPKNGKTE